MGFKSLGKNVLISDKASIYRPDRISIGDNTRIDDFCILSAGVGGIEIGRYVHIACYASILGAGKVQMCDFSGISSRVSIFSSSDSYSGLFMTNPTLPKEVTHTIHDDVYLGKHVVVGCGSVILPGIKLQEGCAVLSMTVVNRSYDKDTIIGGIPGRPQRNRRLPDIYILEKLVP